MNINDNRAHGITLDSIYIDLHDLDNIDNEFKNCTYCALHINKHGLASKFDQLKNLIHELRNSNIKVHFILLCETFRTEANAELYPLPGYSFSHNCRKSRTKGGIALYISDEFTFIDRSDLSMNIEGEFESIIIEVKNKASKNIYISIRESIVRYEQIMTDIANTKNDIFIATDQNFDYMYMKINQNSTISDLLGVFYTFGILPTITRPTRITHSSATLIDNIYIKKLTDISDHLPVIMCTGMHTTPNTREPLIFKHRPMNNEQEN